MWTVISSLLSGGFNLLVNYLQNKQELQKVEAQAAIAIRTAEVNAQITRTERAAQADEETDAELTRQMEHSWKDEYWTFLLSAPLVLCFLGDWGVKVVIDGFNALDVMPEWYKIGVGLAIGTSFGLRGLYKLMNSRTGGK
jgi:hypothetical protein